MIKFEQYNNTATNEAWANITEDGVYNARLFAIRVSKQNEKFIDEGATPKDQISFVFDVLNEQNQSVHVATKPCTISFTDKSTLPKIWEKVTKLTSGADMSKLFYEENGLGDTFKVMIEVTQKDDKIYNTVTKVTAKTKAEIPVCPVTDYDLRVYGQPCEEYDLAEGYELLK